MSVDAGTETIKIDLTDNERRHAVVGIALNNYLVPQIKPFVDEQMKQYYEELRGQYKIHTDESKLTWDVAESLGLNIHWGNVLRNIRNHNQLAKHYQKKHMYKKKKFKSILHEDTDASAILAMLSRSHQFSEEFRKQCGDKVRDETE